MSNVEEARSRYEQAKKHLEKCTAALEKLKSKPVTQPQKREFDIKRMKKEHEIEELKNDNRELTKKIDDLQQKREDLQAKMDSMREDPAAKAIKAEWEKKKKEQRDVTENYKTLRQERDSSIQKNNEKKRTLRQELQRAGFGPGRNRDESTFSYVEEIDRQIRAKEDQLETGMLGTGNMSRLQHEKQLAKEIQQMKKFRRKAEEMDAMTEEMNKAKESEDAKELMRAKKQADEMRNDMNTLKLQRSKENKGKEQIYLDLKKVRDNIREMMNDRKEKNARKGDILKESREIGIEYRKLDQAFFEYQQNVKKAEGKVMKARRDVDDAMRVLNEKEAMIDSGMPEELNGDGPSLNSPANMGGGGGGGAQQRTPPKKKKILGEDNAPSKDMVPKEKKPRQKKPAKQDDKEEEKKQSNVVTQKIRNMQPIKEITALITYLKSLLPDDEKTPSKAKKSTRAGFGGELYGGVAEDDPMASLFNNRPQAKKKKKRKKKVRSDLQHSMESLTLFAKYQVEYPLKLEEIPKCLEELDKKLADFKKEPEKKKANAGDKKAANGDAAAQDAPPAQVEAAGGSADS